MRKIDLVEKVFTGIVIFLILFFMFIISLFVKDYEKQNIIEKKVISNPKYKYIVDDRAGHKKFYLSDGVNEVWVSLELYLKKDVKEIK